MGHWRSKSSCDCFLNRLRVCSFWFSLSPCCYRAGLPHVQPKIGSGGKND